MSYERLMRASCRAFIVWLLSWPLYAVSFYAVSAFLLPRNMDHQAVAGTSAWAMSLLLAGVEFWWDCRRIK